MIKCETCGSSQIALIESIGALQTWKCGSCGKEVTIHVYDPALDPVLPKNLERVFIARGRFAQKPSRENLRDLRILFPRSKMLTDSELLRAAYEKSSFELGRFNDSEIISKIEGIAALNLEIEKEWLN